MAKKRKQNTVNKQLVDEIKEKFNTVARFIRLSRLDERIVRANLYRTTPGAKEVQALILEYARSTPVPDSYEITEADRQELRKLIVENYRNVKNFTTTHPQFSDSYMSYLLSGTIKYRRGKADEVFTIFNI